VRRAFPNEDIESLSMHEQYVTSMYFMMYSLCTVGYGEFTASNDWERIFITGVFVVASIAHAAIFGNIAVQIEQFGRVMGRLVGKLQAMREYAQRHNMPDVLRDRAEKYLTMKWSLDHGVDHHDVLRDLPDHMRRDVLMSIHK
jgi:hypothetical protein